MLTLVLLVSCAAHLQRVKRVLKSTTEAVGVDADEEVEERRRRDGVIFPWSG